MASYTLFANVNVFFFNSIFFTVQVVLYNRKQRHTCKHLRIVILCSGSSALTIRRQILRTWSLFLSPFSSAVMASSSSSSLNKIILVIFLKIISNINLLHVLVYASIFFALSPFNQCFSTQCHFYFAF